MTRIEEKASDIEKSPAVEEKPSPRAVTLEKAYESEAKDSLFSKEKESSEAFAVRPPAHGGTRRKLRPREPGNFVARAWKSLVNLMKQDSSDLPRTDCGRELLLL